jgi:hypothetical protein
MDSYWHKDEKITQDSIDAIEKVLPLIDNNEFKGVFLSVTFPNYVKKIADQAYFYNGTINQIVELFLNEGLEEIGEYAFFNQNIKKIKTPSTLKTIHPYAFINQVNTYNSNESLDAIYLNEGLVTIGDRAFECPRAQVIKDLYIPSSVQTVGQNAFAIPSLLTVSAPTGLDLSNAGIPATATITYR